MPDVRQTIALNSPITRANGSTHPFWRRVNNWSTILTVNK